ncbi:ComEC/Rec2 family competence protein [Oceanibacterium hippocampi]|uniref:ComEC family competence protein n=1 Tax=Oceanibacterium hippocampi TaxID=745714 RepID=A0A1Y5T7C6_9PROT|nr:ComEC/Rec2 family competence protein [Oceanibacterium hippocampi]SLN54196.1 ComEC family competence protein [Oceanibacterium hippocampi]
MFYLVASISARLRQFAGTAARAAAGATPRGALRVAAGNLLAERARWALWTPVGLGVGIAAGLAGPGLPVTVAIPLLGALGLFTAWLARRQSAWTPLAVVVLLPVIGLVLLEARIGRVEAPIIAERTGPVTLTATVVEYERHEGRFRLLLADPEVADLARAATPKRIRLSVNRPAGEGAGAVRPRPGDRVRLTAVLMPPPGPAEPGAFDFARQAYFNRLGAVGFAFGSPEIVGRDSVWSPARAVAILRDTIGERIDRALPGPPGAIASALMTGERGAIPEPVLAALRDVGLAHLLAISGLHMGLLAGALFTALRAALALVPPLALRRPIKKWAAGAALLAAAFYLAVAGAPISAQRAFLMTALVLLAILLDRRAISLRLVALAATAILVYAPESLFSAGFQMSFAAVVALVAAYEWLADPFAAVRRERGPLMRVLLYLVGVGLTTLIAGLATAPFAAFHFNHFPHYGLVANLIAVPVTGLWIMPAALAAFLAMPFGLEAWPLALMGAGIDVVIAVAVRIAAWPNATSAVAAFPDAGLAVIVAGGLWLLLWRRRWRVLGLAGPCLGLLIAAFATPPDIRVSDSGKLIALRAGDGGLLLSTRQADRFAAETWQRRDGLRDAPGRWPRAGPSVDGRLRCDRLGCTYRLNGFLVALPADERALVEDCRRADLVIVRFPIRGRCAGARVIIDGSALRRDGAHALRLGADGRIAVETVREMRGRHPWAGPR